MISLRLTTGLWILGELQNLCSDTESESCIGRCFYTGEGGRICKSSAATIHNPEVQTYVEVGSVELGRVTEDSFTSL